MYALNEINFNGVLVPYAKHLPFGKKTLSLIVLYEKSDPKQAISSVQKLDLKVFSPKAVEKTNIMY